MAEPSRRTAPVAITLAVIGAVVIGAGTAFWNASSQGGDTLASACTLDEATRTALDAAATGQMAAFTIAQEPRSVTDLAFDGPDGTKVRLADWAGRTVLLNLWATWCAPCRAEMPALDALQREEGQTGADGFEVVPVSLDMGSDERPRGFYEEVGLKDLRFFHDGSLDTLNRLKGMGLAFGLPATLLIDAKGCVLGALNGPAAWESEDARALVAVARERRG